MAKRGGSQQERAVGKSWTEHGRKITVADGKILCQAVIERQLALVVEVHGLVFGCVLNAIVYLLRDVIYAHKPIAETLEQRAVGMIEVGFLVRRRPAMIKVGQNAAPGIVESQNRMTIFVNV